MKERAEGLFSYAFLRILCLPDWRHIAQPLDDFRQHLENVIHILLGVVFAKREAKGAVRLFVRQSDGEQHMGGVERAGGAGRAGRSADAMHVEHEQDGFPLNALE